MRSRWKKEFIKAFGGGLTSANERECLLSLLQLVKMELKRIDFAYHGDVPTRIAEHTKKMKDAEKYVEDQLQKELNDTSVSVQVALDGMGEFNHSPLVKCDALRQELADALRQIMLLHFWWADKPCVSEYDKARYKELTGKEFNPHESENLYEHQDSHR